MKREYPDQPVVAVGVAVRRDGRVLVVQRARQPGEGQWTLPGGVVELGERMELAAAREVYEECGLVVEVRDVLGVVDRIEYDEAGRLRYHYAIVDFLADYADGELHLNQELRNAVWADAAQLDDYPLSPLARAMLLKALA